MILKTFLSLGGRISEINSDHFFYDLKLNNENKEIIQRFFESELIEHLKDRFNQIISIDELNNFYEKDIRVEFLTSELKKIGFYISLTDFISDNRFEIPSNYYIYNLRFSSDSGERHMEIDKYECITNLIDTLISKAKFISDEHTKTICLVNDNLFVEIPIDNVNYEENLNYEIVEIINQYTEDIKSYKEKRTIFLKELLDYLATKPKSERFSDLICNFQDIYDKCNTSFEYYLSNFSFNKIKLEIDNSVLDYSKNIRSIINDSQSKLIAIPAAFILGASQIDYSTPFTIKNCIIIVSAFLFSYIISIFITNQKNAIDIISDNLFSYKINYERSKSNQFEEERELKSLSELIKESFTKIEIEINEQRKRLGIFQYCNWGISISLLISLLIAIISEIKWLFYF